MLSSCKRYNVAPMIQTNKYNIKAGDVIEFINRVNYRIVKTVTRVEEKSCYTSSRESWNTINEYIEKYNATINGQPVK